MEGLLGINLLLDGEGGGEDGSGSSGGGSGSGIGFITQFSSSLISGGLGILGLGELISGGNFETSKWGNLLNEMSEKLLGGLEVSVG
jgi:hypothetical protein